MIFKLKKKVAFTISLIHKGNRKEVWDAFLRRINSEEIAYGFKRDLNKKITKPRTLLMINTRVFQQGDEQYFLERKNDGLINEFQTCYVATTKEGIPCFHLWLIDFSQNKILKKIWGNTFPMLSKDEMLIENVYTVPKYRGMGIFPAVLNEIAEKSKILGANYNISFGETSNINMSRSFAYAGFEPYILRRKKWFLFRKSITFEEIPLELMEEYTRYTAAYRAKPLK